MLTHASCEKTVRWCATDETVAAASAAEHGEALRGLGSTKHKTEDNACGAPDKHADPGGAHTAAVPASRPNRGERRFCLDMANVHYGDRLSFRRILIIAAALLPSELFV